MKVLHVISSITRQGGGPSRSSQGLVAGLRAAGVDAWLMTLVRGEEPWIKGCDQFVNGGSFEEALTRVSPDIVHLHGIWDVRLHRCAVVCRQRKIPYVIAPRGMLEPWSLKQKWLKKRVARFLYQDRDLKKAAALHATAESEAEQFRKLGFKNYCIVSPNGVNVPEGKKPCRDVEDVEKSVVGEKPCRYVERVGRGAKDSKADSDVRALFVSRMHPKKGVIELVESWGRVVRSGTVVNNAITANWYDIVSADKIEGLPIVEIEMPKAPLVCKREIKDLFKSFGVVENALDGRSVTFPAKSVGKMMGQRGVDLYRIAGSFAKLFTVSRRAWSESEAAIETHKQHRNIDAYHQYIAKFRDGTDECYIRFTVREDKGGKAARNEIHSSTVSRIVVYKAKGAELSSLGHAQAEDSTPFVDNKISYFLNRVNPLANWVCELVYTLNGEEERAYEAEVKARVKELGLDGQFIFTGPLNDDAKWEAYARADLFVLPTYSENFGIVVAEALWAGVPVITTKGTPWEELEPCRNVEDVDGASERCGWWIDLPGKKKTCGEGGWSVEWPALDKALLEAACVAELETSQSTRSTFSTRLTLAQMGANGHRLVESKYTWKAVCDKMVAGYEKILAV